MLSIFDLFLIIFIINKSSSFERQKFYRCGFDNEKFEPLILKGLKPINKTNNLNKRKLDADGFHDFNIYLDVKNIERDITSNGLSAYHDLFIDSMKNAVKTIQSLLK